MGCLAWSPKFYNKRSYSYLKIIYKETLQLDSYFSSVSSNGTPNPFSIKLYHVNLACRLFQTEVLCKVVTIINSNM